MAIFALQKGWRKQIWERLNCTRFRPDEIKFSYTKRQSFHENIPHFFTEMIVIKKKSYLCNLNVVARTIIIYL